jgi:hypothetical protein
MSRKYLLLILSFVFTLVLVSQAAAKDFIPAGTILHCTMDEVNFSPKTAEIGDPVLCHLGPLGAFGHSIFPRGAELGGHLQDYKAPGHFVGKGWMAIEFDRLILPNANVLPLSAKVTSAPHLKTDSHGDIKGGGHVKRDVALWMVPLFWPIKVFTLPMRGPYPALKGESRLTLRLMEDVEVPFSVAHDYPAPPWKDQQSSYNSNSSSLYQPASTTASSSPIQRVNYGARVAASSNAPVTVIALQAGGALLASRYWLQGTSIHCVSAAGAEQDVPLSMVDLAQTVKLNQERNVDFVLASRAVNVKTSIEQ